MKASFRFETFELDFGQPIQASVSRRDQFNGIGPNPAPCAKCRSAEPAWQVVDDPKRGYARRSSSSSLTIARTVSGSSTLVVTKPRPTATRAELVVRELSVCHGIVRVLCDCLCVLYGVAQSRQPDHPSGVAGPEEMSVLGRKK